MAKLGRHEGAVAQFEKVLAQRPDHLGALNNLGTSLNALTRPAEALAAFQRVLAANPRSAEAEYGAGIAMLQLGRLADARATFERAVALAPKVPAYHRFLAGAKTFREDDPQLAALEALAQDMPSFPEAEQIDLHFALAKAYDDIQRYDRAFAHLRDGNALKRQAIVYDEAEQLAVSRDIANVFTSELIEARRGQGNPSDVPVFIVGMPRSGSTLVEQILASHPRVFGGGEVDYLSGLVTTSEAGVKFPAGFASLSGGKLRQLGSLYVARLRHLAPQADRITDKMLFNFFFVGLLQLVLPKARIIHVRRDPLDTCFSCYAKMFATELNCAHDLGELGRYYRAYEALMAHWRSVLPAGAMLEVQYETLVENFEEEVRRIVAYCGLEWNERCLEFYRTERSVRTASVVQVRQPLFKSSIGRWRLYEPYLGPLIEALNMPASGAG